MTPSQVNKLGEKLRAAGPPSEELLDRLQVFRSCFEAPMLAAIDRLRGIGEEPTARIKTVNTIVEKLRREKMRLSKMQDIAGLRIVKAMSLSEQDSLVTEIAQQFPGCKIIDRRAQPSFGYRAVHLVASIDEYALEIQVRTRVQDSWAQSMEKVADTVGRGIRYGEPVPERARDIVAALFEMSEVLAVYEAEATKLRAITDEARELDATCDAFNIELDSAREEDAPVFEARANELAFAAQELSRKHERQGDIVGLAISSIDALLKRIGGRSKTP